MMIVIGTMTEVAPELAAQDRDGFWFGLGLGAGWQIDEPPAGLTSFGCVFSLKAGGTPARWLRVGGEALTWGSTSEGVERASGNLMVTGQAYPMVDYGFFVKAGFGLAGSLIGGSVSGTSTNTGFGSALGVGYEFQPGGSLLLTVAADWMIQLIDVGQGTSTSSFLLLTVGIGTW